MLKKIEIKNFLEKYPALIFAILSSIWFLQLEISNGNDFSEFKIIYIFLNIGTVLALALLVFCIADSLVFTSIFFNVFFMILGIANYFVVQFRGTPLSTKDIKSFETAVNVLGSYSFHFGVTFWIEVILFILNCYLSYRIYELNHKTTKWNRKFFLLIVTSIFLYIGYFAPVPVQPSNVLGWSWKEAYYQYGYIAVSVDVFRQSFNVIDKPLTYSEETLRSYYDILEKYQTYDLKKQPNIILIINESWYDMSQIADYETNMEVMPFIDNLKGSQKGHAVVPGIGGGTNLTEYEVLTGNSLQLMQGITPFNVLDLENANSIVSVLNRNGYSAVSLHPASEINYNRSVAYSELGFKDMFWENDFDNWEMEGSHWFASDKSNFQNLMEIYEKNFVNQPLFLYNLTIQNHGDYLLNSDDENIIKILSGIDDEKDKKRMEEYLTCLHKTDEAFRWLTEYLTEEEHPVIVMMVGDHSPSFAERIVNKDELSEQEILLYEHSTPFIIWSNYGLAEKEYGYISSNYLAALLLDCAGVSLSQYYSWMLNDLMGNVPVITSFNQYIDKEGNYYVYDNGLQELDDKLAMYFNLEYDNVIGKYSCEYFK